MVAKQDQGGTCPREELWYLEYAEQGKIQYAQASPLEFQKRPGGVSYFVGHAYGIQTAQRGWYFPGIAQLAAEAVYDCIVVAKSAAERTVFHVTLGEIQ